LEERLQRSPRLTLVEIVDIARQTTEGLAAAHEQGLIHRDVKPANIWLETPGTSPPDDSGEQASKPWATTLLPVGIGWRVKLLDFGLARGISPEDSAITGQGTFVGTPAYMAPEQARCQATDQRADLFSLGVVLYRLCLGVLPFQGPNASSVIMALA